MFGCMCFPCCRCMSDAQASTLIRSLRSTSAAAIMTFVCSSRLSSHSILSRNAWQCIPCFLVNGVSVVAAAASLNNVRSHLTIIQSREIPSFLVSPDFVEDNRKTTTAAALSSLYTKSLFSKLDFFLSFLSLCEFVCVLHKLSPHACTQGLLLFDWTHLASKW